MQENKSKKPLVSVVIPMYNRGRVIGRAIESVLQQTLSDLELIVVDDCSKDDSCEVVGAFDDSRIRLIRNKNNRGANYCRNLGIRESKGNYIAFQDSDDEWTKDKLQVQIEYMKQQGLKASFCPYKVIESSIIIPKDYQELIKNYNLVREALRKYNVVGTPTLVIDRAILDDIGFFDERLPRLQDYEYAIRIVKKYDIGCCPDILLNVHTGEERVSSNRERLDIAIGIIVEKHIDFIDLNHFFATRYMVLDEENRFSKSVFDKLITNETFNTFAIDYLKKEITLQEKRRNTLFEINSRRLENKDFSIYGAGKYAKVLYKSLRKQNKIPLYFLVTNIKYDDVIDDIEIRHIDTIEDKNMTIVVAVAPATQTEILELLRDKGFCDVFTV